MLSKNAESCLLVTEKRQPEGDTTVIFHHPRAHLLGTDHSVILPVLLACLKASDICLLKCKGCCTMTA